MNNEETIIMSDKKSNVNPTEKATQQETEQKSSGWKTAGVAGAAGIAIGGAATAAAMAFSNHDADADAEPAIVDVEGVNGTAHVDSTIPLAHVDDDLSFQQAWESAREQVGPGGVFEWHGHVYNTYSADEWGSMSQAEHEQFASHVDVTYDEPAQTPVHETMDHSTAETTPDDTYDTASAGTDYTNHDNQDPVVQTADDEPEIQVLGVEHLTSDEGQEYVLGAIGNEQGQIMFADVDNDGTFDLAAYDADHSGTIEEGEVHDISDQGLQVSDLEQQYELQQMQDDVQVTSNDDTPDFDNNVDFV